MPSPFKILGVTLGSAIALLVVVTGCAPLPPQPRPTSTGELSAEDVAREQRAAAELPRDGGATRRLGTYRGLPVEVAYVCFGDVCPDNGGYFVRYVGVESQANCEAMGGEPILGTGWGVVYGGCGVRLEAAE